MGYEDDKRGKRPASGRSGSGVRRSGSATAGGSVKRSSGTGRRKLSKAEKIRRKRRKKLIHNIRAVLMWIACLLVLFLLIRGVVWAGKSIVGLFKGKPQVEETSPVVEEEDGVDIVMVGDVLLHDPINEAAKREDGTYDYTAVFSKVKSQISNADLALINQEVIIGGADIGVSGYPAFNAPYDLADDLVKTGFDVILHATNHAFDAHEIGIMNCLNNWNTKYPNVAVVGIHDSQEDADVISIVERDGINIAVLNYTYGTNDKQIPNDKNYLLDFLREDEVRADIQKAKQLSDFVIVAPHWGTEFNLETSDEQEQWNQIFLEEGVDLVLGTHPHVIEPVKMLTNQSDGHKMLVYYSLGNFVSWTTSTGDGVSNRSLGGMAKVTIQKQEDGSVSITDYGIEALVTHVTSGKDGVTVIPLADYTEELAELNEIKKQDANFSREYCVNLCNQVWGSKWE